MRLLFLSNGNGEDAIAAAIAAELRDLGPVAFPLVGTGGAFHRAGIPVVGPTLDLPSGGFNFHNGRAFRADWRAGLGGLLRRQWAFLRGSHPETVIAVGDLLPVLGARLSGGKSFFVGANKSDYYREKGYSYLPIELHFLRRWGMKVFPRDRKTHERLQASRIDSEYLGNPMMDTFETAEGSNPCIALFPGSRAEALHNLESMLPVVEAMKRLEPGLRFEVALAPSLPSIEYPGLTISRDFGQTLGNARLVLGMAGTANEQAVGLGKPVISWPGAGPQYTARFARLQAQLLGEALQVLAYDPKRIAERALETLTDEAYLARLPALGKERLGVRGAARRIAERIRIISAL